LALPPLKQGDSSFSDPTCLAGPETNRVEVLISGSVNWGVPHPTQNQKVDPQYAGLLLHKLPSVRRVCAFYTVEALRCLLIYKFGP